MKKKISIITIVIVVILSVLVACNHLGGDRELIDSSTQKDSETDTHEESQVVIQYENLSYLIETAYLDSLAVPFDTLKEAKEIVSNDFKVVILLNNIEQKSEYESMLKIELPDIDFSTHTLVLSLGREISVMGVVFEVNPDNPSELELIKVLTSLDKTFIEDTLFCYQTDEKIEWDEIIIY